jgi:hypothetical protein
MMLMGDVPVDRHRRFERADVAGKAWLLCFAFILGLYFFVWWLSLKPGIFSFDSGFYLQEVLSGKLTDRKPFLYARFLQITSLNGACFELSVLIQAALVVFVISRAFEIAAISRASIPVMVFCAVLILNPFVLFMAFYVQNDVLYCFAIIAILIETLNISRLGSVGKVGYVVVAIFSPMAFGFRENGLLFLPLWWLLLPLFMRRALWVRLVITSVLSTALVYGSIVGVDRSDRHDIFYPAAIHESIRLAQPVFGHAGGGLLSSETRDSIGPAQVASAVPLYWPLYWDTIAFFPQGPQLAELPPSQRGQIVSSFLRHDLAPNLPSVLAHRVEIFLAATLARAEYVDPYSAPANIPETLAAEKDGVRDTGLLGRVARFSIQSRAWTWNALLGVGVLSVLTFCGLWCRDVRILAICFLLWVQATAVLALAPSAEYRYVFMLYLAPLILLVKLPSPNGYSAKTNNVSLRMFRWRERGS